jgi:hypothetical protein
MDSSELIHSHSCAFSIAKIRSTFSNCELEILIRRSRVLEKSHQHQDEVPQVVFSVS